ncbi:hypothetical protein, partial [Chromobacterium haemolyticum]|uniref:hypothetical protein n=1 Tax=Chromobacterium haemolyticum TaxID=394935 RepID=UPI00196319B5
KTSEKRAKNERKTSEKSGMYTWYMSILSLFLTPYRHSAADHEQVLRSTSRANPSQRTGDMEPSYR